MKGPIFFAILFLQVLYADCQSTKEKILRYIKLVPLTEWSSHGLDLSSKQRDSLIAEAIRSDSDVQHGISNGQISFNDKEFPTFTLFEAQNGKDLLLQVNAVDRWINLATFWQYDVAKNRLSNITKKFDRARPSIKSFFPADFSFDGKDTSDHKTDLRIQCYSNNNTLIYYIATDGQSPNNWINQARADNLLFEWLGRWNGTSFIWKRQKEE